MQALLLAPSRPAFAAAVYLCPPAWLTGCQESISVSADTDNPPADSRLASDTGDVVEPAGADDQDDQLPTITKEGDCTDYRIVAPPAESGPPGEWNFEVVSAGPHTRDARIFIWDFGDGESQEGQAVSRTSAAGGTYTVTVTAARKGRTLFVLTIDIDITLPGMPPVANGGSNSVMYEGEEVCLDASASYDPNNNPITPTGINPLVTPTNESLPCDDGDVCNVGETCQAGSCTGGAAPDCSDAGDQCNDASCDPAGADGTCEITNSGGIAHTKTSGQRVTAA